MRAEVPGERTALEPTSAVTLGDVLAGAVLPFVIHRTLLLLAVGCAAALLEHVQRLPHLPVADTWPSVRLMSLWLQWDGVEWMAAALRATPSVDTAVSTGWGGYPRFLALLGSVAPLPAAALFVSNLAALAAAVMIHTWARLHPIGASPRWAVWLLLLSPTSYILAAANPESIFLAAAAATFAMSGSGRFGVAAAAGAFGSFVHPAGCALLAAPFVVHWLTLDRRSRVPWFVLAAPAAAALALVWGSDLSALELRPLSAPVFRIGPTTYFAVEALPGMVTWVIAAIGTVGLLRRRRLDAGLYCAGCLMLPWLSITSIGRAGVLAFPAWCLVAHWSGAERERSMLAACLVPLQLVAAVLFVLGLSAD